MGNLNPHPIIYHSSLNMEEWDQVQPNLCGHRSTHGTFISYEHKTSHEQIDKYELQFTNKKQQENYYECYLQRYQYVDLSQRQFCSHLYRGQVFIQHIPVRLGDVTDIPYPDNLYIMKNALLGFASLYGMIGYFEVQEDHFCINNYGELKVWLNTDLSKNYPQDYDQEMKSECEMVNRVIQLVQKNTNIQQCPIEVSEYFVKKHKKNPKFSQAVHLIDQYIKDYKTIMPKYCESILQIFNEDSKTVQLNQIFKQQEDTSKSLQINGIVIPKLPIGGTERSQQQNMSRSGSRSMSMSMSRSRRDTVKRQSPFDMIYSHPDQDIRTRLITQTTERILPPVRSSIATSPHKVILQNYNRLETKRTPVKQFITYSMISNTTKPRVNFTYRSPQPQMKESILIRLPVYPLLPYPASQYKSEQPKHEQPDQSIARRKIQLCYYDTGTGSEQIDPEIAADLIKYL